MTLLVFTNSHFALVKDAIRGTAAGIRQHRQKLSSMWLDSSTFHQKPKQCQKGQDKDGQKKRINQTVFNVLTKFETSILIQWVHFK
jgi:hypothetical protein